MLNSGKNIIPIQISEAKPKFRKSTGLEDRKKLEAFLKKQGLVIKLGKILYGGVDSQVYEASYNSNKIVVKHTEDRGDKLLEPPFTPIDFYIARENHNIDVKILNLLSKTTILVPKVLYEFPKQTTTIMSDLRTNGFELLSNQIIRRSLNINSAINIGKSLGLLCNFGQNTKVFNTVKNRYMQIFERGLELRLLYPNLQTEYLKLKKEFTNHVQGWMWPDGHPKNMFVNNQGEVAFIDFGGTYWGDQRFMLPNFLAHIILFSLAGYINVEVASNYISECINGFKMLQPIKEDLFCKYLGMEICHRSFGKWIYGIETADQKIACLSFAMEIFDKNITTINNLTVLLKNA